MHFLFVSSIWKSRKKQNHSMTSGKYTIARYVLGSIVLLLMISLIVILFNRGTKGSRDLYMMDDLTIQVSVLQCLFFCAGFVCHSWSPQYSSSCHNLGKVFWIRESFIGFFIDPTWPNFMTDLTNHNWYRPEVLQVFNNFKKMVKSSQEVTWDYQRCKNTVDCWSLRIPYLRM